MFNHHQIVVTCIKAPKSKQSKVTKNGIYKAFYDIRLGDYLIVTDDGEPVSITSRHDQTFTLAVDARDDRGQPSLEIATFEDSRK